MAAIDNLTAIVTTIEGQIPTIKAAIDALKAVPNNDVAVQAAADRLTAVSTAITTAIQ